MLDFLVLKYPPVIELGRQINKSPGYWKFQRTHPIQASLIIPGSIMNKRLSTVKFYLGLRSWNSRLLQQNILITSILSFPITPRNWFLYLKFKMKVNTDKTNNITGCLHQIQSHLILSDLCILLHWFCYNIQYSLVVQCNTMLNQGIGWLTQCYIYTNK